MNRELKPGRTGSSERTLGEGTRRPGDRPGTADRAGLQRLRPPARDVEAFPMLLAMSQGNNGSMCTLHADSSKSVFPKLAAYVAMAGAALPVETVNLLIAT